MDVQDGPAATRAWKSSNKFFSGTCRWSFTLTTGRQVPSRRMQCWYETCPRAAPGSCASQALPNFTCSPASQDQSCGAIPTLLCNLLAPALSCWTHVPPKFPCLSQVFHQPFAKPKAAFASWDICMARRHNCSWVTPAKRLVCLQVCSLQQGGRREKIRGREMAKDAARGGRTDCWETEGRGHCLLVRKQVGFFVFLLI